MPKRVPAAPAVRTEANLQMVEDGTWDEASGGLDLADGETPTFSGRAVAQLASLGPEAMMARSGNVEVVAELAQEFGFTDVGGSRPASARRAGIWCWRGPWGGGQGRW